VNGSAGHQNAFRLVGRAVRPADGVRDVGMLRIVWHLEGDDLGVGDFFLVPIVRGAFHDDHDALVVFVMAAMMVMTAMLVVVGMMMVLRVMLVIVFTGFVLVVHDYLLAICKVIDYRRKCCKSPLEAFPLYRNIFYGTAISGNVNKKVRHTGNSCYTV